MSELIHQFGIDWKILIAQIINFAILVFVLNRFLYKPLLKVLDKRKESIEKTEQKVKDIDSKMENADRLKEELIEKARKESEKILNETKENAKKLEEKMVNQAKEEALKVTESERKKFASEREKLMSDVKREIGETVTLAVEKTVGDVIDENASRKLTEEAISKINS